MWSTAKIATASNSTLSRCDSIWSAERFVGQWFATIHCDQFALARDRLIKDHVIIWSAVLQDRNVPWPVCFGTSMNWSRIHLPIYGDMCRGLIHSVTHSHFLGRLRAINCNACQSKARIVVCSHVSRVQQGTLYKLITVLHFVEGSILKSCIVTAL